MGFGTTNTKSSGFGSVGKDETTNLNALVGLKTLAEQSGMGEDAAKITNTENKLSFLQRVERGFGALNPAEAIMTYKETNDPFASVGKYLSGAAGSVGAAVTGKDMLGSGERRYFKDVAEDAGIENKIAQFGIGFVGDVLLDPSTYFGGAIAKGVGKVASKAGSVALKGVGKIAPEAETGLRMAGTALKDATGRAFQFGYKSTKGAREDVLTYLSKEQQAKLGLAASNLDRLGTGVLTNSQREELALKLIGGKRAEFKLGESVSSDAINRVNTLFPEMKIKNVQHAEKILDDLESITQKNVSDIRDRVDDIVKPYFDSRQKAIKSGKLIESKMGIQITPALGSFSKVDDLNRVVDKLKEQLSLIRRGRKPLAGIGNESVQDLGGVITKEESVNAHNSLIKYEEERLVDVIDDLSKKIEKVKTKPINNGIKGLDKTDLTPEEVIVYGERMIKKLQNDLAEKSQLLSTATAGRITGSSLIKEARATGDWSKISKIAPDIVDDLKTDNISPEIKNIFETQMARSKKLSEGIVENPYETYFPFIKKDKVDRFLNESRGMQVGSEGYRKQFKNLLTNENLELDPAKAFFTRENQIVSDRMTRDFLSGFVKKYGKGVDEFKSSDEALAAGYKMIKEKGVFGKEVGYVNKYDADLIRDSINPEFQTINMLAKATGFDAVTSLFKRSVTGLFAPFHIRNYISGTIQNFEVLGKDALNPKNIAVGQKIAYAMAKGEDLKGLMNIGGKEMKMSAVMKPFKDRFFGDTFYNTDFNMALDKGSQIKSALGMFSKERLKETVKTVGLGEEGIPFKIARGIGQFIEHQQKATAYVTALSQGKKVDDALRLAEAAGFDYRALTRFESQIMKRIIPFYSFTRKNIELQLKTMGENPQRINQVIRFFDNMGTGEPMSEEEKKYLPNFIKESLGVRLQDTPEGLKQYISSFGTPIEAFTQLFGSNPILRALSMTNPILKAPIEIGIGKDSFRQRDLKDVYQADEYSAAPKIIKDLLDIKEVQKKIYKKNAKGEMEESGEKTVYVADPVKLIIARSLFTSRGVSYLDQVFDGDPNKLVKALKLTTGVKPTSPIDLEAQKYFKETEQKRELEDLLMRTGEVKKFETIYIPKDEKEKKGFGK